MKNQARVLVFDKFTLQNLADTFSGMQTSRVYFLYITSEVNGTICRCLFIVRPQTEFLFALFKLRDRSLFIAWPGRGGGGGVGRDLGLNTVGLSRSPL